MTSPIPTEGGHTPGPWFTVETESSVDADNVTGWQDIAAEGALVAIAVSSDWPGFGDLDANARLIAAAPALLEALKKVLPAAEHAYHTLAFTAPNGGDWWAEIKEARAALALATGGEDVR